MPSETQRLTSIVSVLRERTDAVEEARIGGAANLAKLRDILKGLPDLARGLCSIQYGRVGGRYYIPTNLISEMTVHAQRTRYSFDSFQPYWSRLPNF